MINYLKGGSAVAVAMDNPLKLTNESLCGKNIGVTKGSTQQLKHLPNVSKWTCEEKGQPAINAITLPNVQEALTQLDSKRIDGVFYDASALAWANDQQPNHFSILEPRMDTRTNTSVAMGLKKGSPLTPALQQPSSPSWKPRNTRIPEYWGLGRISHHRSRAPLSGLNRSSQTIPQERGHLPGNRCSNHGRKTRHHRPGQHRIHGPLAGLPPDRFRHRIRSPRTRPRPQRRRRGHPALPHDLPRQP